MQQKHKLYQALALLLQRHHTLTHSDIERPIEQRTAMVDAIEGELERLVKEHLPSGSGVDSGTQLDPDLCKWDKRSPYPAVIVLSTAFHHMHPESGMYDGWTEHQVQLRPDWVGFHLFVTGRDRRGIKDYLGDLYHTALMAEIDADTGIIG